MFHPFVFARTSPDKPAIIMVGSGERISYRELEQAANRHAHLLRSLGLKRGDCVAAMLENEPTIFALAWAADRAGLYFTPISTRLAVADVEYILRDSGSAALFVSDASSVPLELADKISDIHCFAKRGAGGIWHDLDAALGDFPDTPLDDESKGEFMLYSSGTTGRPKGVKRPLPESGILTQPPISPILSQVYGGSSATVYLSPAPLYHAAPIGWSMQVQRVGGTVVVMEKFDAEAALAAIEQYEVTLAQFVPTHFIRMLKLDEAVRKRFDLSSLNTVFHAAAPCPVPIKQAMLDWLGPIVHEYYAGTEGNGATIIGPQDWERKPGSVGKPIGCTVYVCDEAGVALPPGETGQIFFAGGATFEYHNDPDKTRESRNSLGWSSLGDVGHVDDDGYLFLTDRKSFMIISGGVNIYPQEIENLLITHPKVADVAVIGAPDDDMGERVIAVVEPADGVVPDDALGEELRKFCREQLGGVKVPRQVDFTSALPRHPTGKLYKRLIRDHYWAKSEEVAACD